MQLQLGTKREEGALKLQRLWRAYTNRKIYKYYRDIINFRCKGNPSKLLKGINPNQGILLENSASCHVRFKLGGGHFPPVIYYKIFTSSNVIDINAFAPRDYAALPRKGDVAKVAYTDYTDNRSEYEKEGWYLRCDNNGWRPISHKMFQKTDQIENSSARKVQYYHFDKKKRLDKCSKKARMIRTKWMKEIYDTAKHNMVIKQEADPQPGSDKQDSEGSEMEEYDPNKHRVKPKETQDEEELQKQVKMLLTWSQNIDYLDYAKYWFTLSTSESSNRFGQVRNTSLATDTASETKRKLT